MSDQPSSTDTEISALFRYLPKEVLTKVDYQYSITKNYGSKWKTSIHPQQMSKQMHDSI